MQTRIRRWGNSLGVRIPKVMAHEVGVTEGSDVELIVVEGNLVVRPNRSPHYSLAELLANVTATNLHGEIDTGQPVGGEMW